jgi:hypothetical protein
MPLQKRAFMTQRAPCARGRGSGARRTLPLPDHANNPLRLAFESGLRLISAKLIGAIHYIWITEENMAFFELRSYRIKDGKREKWVRFMEEKIIPFQVERGMVIAGSWVDEEQPDHYMWLRRFESEDERKALYKAVYEDPKWTSDMKPAIDEMLDRTKMVVTRLVASPKSVLR